MDSFFDQELAQKATPEDRIAALLSYVDANHRKSPQKAAHYGNMLLQELELSRDEKSQLKAYILCGRISWFKSDLKTSQSLYEKALELANQLNDQYSLVQSLVGIGNAYADLDEFDEALKQYFEALKIAEENNYSDYMVALYNNLGEVYKNFKAYDKALEHYQLALHFVDDLMLEKNPAIYSILKQNIGEIYTKMGQFELARALLLEAIDSHLNQENYVSIAEAYHIMAVLEFQDHAVDLSLAYFEKSDQQFEKMHDLINHIPMLLSYASMVEDIGRDAQAEDILLRALNFAREMNQPHWLSSVTSALASFYEKHFRFETALMLYKDYHDNDKKCDRLKTNQRLDSIKARFESEENSRRTEHYRTASNVYKERTEDLEKAYERISLISNIGKRLTSTQDLKAIYEYMYHSLMRVLPIDGFVMSVYNEISQRLDIKLFMEGNQKVEVESVDIHNKASLLVWCYKNNKEIFSNNILLEYLDYIDESVLYVGDPLIQSVVYMPVQLQGKAIGVLSVQSKQRDAYDSTHLEFLKALSAYIAIAMSNAMKSKILIDEIEMRKAAQAELQILNHSLKDLSERDGLTGVANRHRLEDYLHQLASQKNEKVYLYMIDIDFFKNYNDTYGHLKGDEVLIEVAQTLEVAFVGAGGFFARYGGEEFAGILLDADRAQAESFAEKVLDRIRQLKIPHEASVLETLTVSVGYAQSGKSTSLEKTLNYADRALYLSKRTGRNKASLHE